MITSIVFDYGRVLAYPISGNWFIPYNLFAILKFKNLVKLMFKKRRLNDALKKGNEYLTANHKLSTEEEEYEQFARFYRIVFSELNMTVSDSMVQKLAHSIVYDDFRIRFYDDVVEGIKQLKQKYKVFIVSDTWPSIKRVLKNNEILELLDGLVMSCEYGETKESTKLFEIAANQLQLNPAECLFIDDSAANLANAKKTGFIPVLMARDASATSADYPVIESLDDIQAVIDQQENDQVDNDKSENEQQEEQE
jgi:putative hydrolase of the HAD superfamily